MFNKVGTLVVDIEGEEKDIGSRIEVCKTNRSWSTRFSKNRLYGKRKAVFIVAHVIEVCPSRSLKMDKPD